jgi:hypothetical protein
MNRDLKIPAQRVAGKVVENLLEPVLALDTPDIICCPKCRGEGRISLSEAFAPLAETLALLREHGPMTANELQPMVSKKILITGINNRLEDLRSLGLVSREKRSREWLYSAL